MSANEVRNIINRREITALLHFTRTDHLASIFRNGIVPIAQARDNNLDVIVNDVNRFDRRTDASSLSVSFPNYKMFFKYRSLEENRGVNWAVLAISPSVLIDNYCLFCKYNAADARMSNQPNEALENASAFESMFDEQDDISRSELKVKNKEPTDVQAEVLVYGVIPPEKIIGAYFSNPSVLRDNAHHFGTRKLVVNSNIFSKRDYGR